MDALKIHAQGKRTCNGKYTEKQKTEIRIYGVVLVAATSSSAFINTGSWPGNRLLDFERTRKGPIVEKSGEMSLHRHRMMLR